MQLSTSFTEPDQLIRYFDYRVLIETFIVSAVVAILGIRFYLSMTGYPIVGNDYFHISHMLWGGLCMSIALIQFMIFLNPQSRYIAAVLGGIGFGTFIDEVGKFITHDNNYFFQPSFAIIYLIFILIFLIVHLLNRNHAFTSQEYLINSIELMKQAAIHDLDRYEKEQALSYLMKADQQSIVTVSVKELYQKINAIKQPKKHLFTRIRSVLLDYYVTLATKSWFRKSIILFFLFQAALSLVIALLIIFEKNSYILPALLLPTILSSHQLHTIHLYSVIVSTIFVINGAIHIYRSRMKGFIMFKRSVLVSILIGEVFAFSANPVRAFIMLMFHLIILTALNAMIDQERAAKLRQTPSN